MSMICRVMIGYFDPNAACAQRTITPSKPLDDEQVARLQAACDALFGIKMRLAEQLTEGGVLCIEDVVIRRDTYRAACVAHEVFGMSVIDHAHRGVIFPAEDSPPAEQEQLLEFYHELFPDWDEEQRRQKANEDLQWVREEEKFERETQERVRSFAQEWRTRT